MTLRHPPRTLRLDSQPIASLLLAGALMGCTTTNHDAAPMVPFRSAEIFGPGSLSTEGFLATQDGQAKPDDATDALAKKSQNPIADLISLPFEFATDQNWGPGRDSRNTLTIKPVIPFELDEDWNLVTRTIVPLISQPGVGPGQDRKTGIGDTNLQLFFSPKEPTESGIVWGVGPIFQLPTHSNDVLGNEKWAAGPTAVALVMEGPWVAGAVGQHLWSTGGSDKSSDINQSLIQPFANYNFGNGSYLVSAPIITANWEADSGGDVWTVPVGGGLGHLFHMGRRPVNVNLQAFYNVHRPEDAGNWSARLQFTLLYPDKPKPGAP